MVAPFPVLTRPWRGLETSAGAKASVHLPFGAANLNWGFVKEGASMLSIIQILLLILNIVWFIIIDSLWLVMQ